MEQLPEWVKAGGITTIIAAVLGLVGLIGGGLYLWSPEGSAVLETIPEPIRTAALLAGWIGAVFLSGIQCQLTGERCGI